jgi:hypothetical protein
MTGEIIVVCIVWIYSGSRYDDMWRFAAAGEAEMAVGDLSAGLRGNTLC